MADTLFRDFDGQTRRVERRGASAAKAETALKEYLLTRSRAGRVGEVTPETRVRDVGALWLAQIREEGRAVTTLDAYDDAMRIHVVPGVGLLQVRELTVGVCDRFLTSVKTSAGPSAAKHAKTVLNGLVGLAARHDAIKHNPVRDTSKITIAKKDARALSLDEVRKIRAGLAADPEAVARDLPAIVDFMLGTGLRIGETIAITAPALDLKAATVEVRATVVRAKGVGLILQPKPKTHSGWRQLHLPAWLVAVLKAREVAETDLDLIFPSQRGKLRERSNTNADVREALDKLGFDWVTTHTFRKTTATLLDEGGLTVREIADQLGHKRVSITQDTYFGRSHGTVRAAAVLGSIERVRAVSKLYDGES
ncbi:site-specific integrase [Kineosporia succinea]|uniref:Integrase n=1 Tax=Kineosporia succinea TaxID=84632 RepID=A0ABT9P1J9_9ACTN|nr:site-specific integrase [Kineosporia succinea]MDP9826533.1 integrase [Kineosporia succinea]